MAGIETIAEIVTPEADGTIITTKTVTAMIAVTTTDQRNPSVTRHRMGQRTVMGVAVTMKTAIMALMGLTMDSPTLMAVRLVTLEARVSRTSSLVPTRELLQMVQITMHSFPSTLSSNQCSP